MDTVAKRELELYLTNTSELYNQRVSIEENLRKKMKAGKYDAKLAPKAWRHWVDAGAKRYSKEFSTGKDSATMFPGPLRNAIAADLAKSYEADLNRWGAENSMNGLASGFLSGHR